MLEDLNSWGGNMRKKAGCMILMLVMLLTVFGGSAAASEAPYINLKTVSIEKGHTVSLRIVNNSKTVKWSSSDTKIATVSKGKVTGKKKGTVSIKAKAGKKTYTCKVKVSDGNAKSLVVYFSKSGTTRAAAKKIAAVAGADLLEIKTRKTYTSDYDKLLDIAEKEQKNNSRPAVSTGIKNLKQYDVIYLGYPIWWGKEPMAVRTFLEKYKWTGKTVIPFCTSGGSGIKGSLSGIKKYASGAKVIDGKDLSDMTTAEISDWAKSFAVKETPDKTNILVVYFSRTGKTKPLAEYAADYLNADIYEIEAKVPYTDADIAYYTDCRADREQSDPAARPEIAGSVADMDQYATIILGYPIWHGQAPRIIDTFMESYDFSGKTIVPFCTSQSSGIGSSDTALYKLVSSDAVWKAGRRFAAGTSKEEIVSWLKDSSVEPCK